ncbi:MAG: hypothetical protein M8352_05295 [ANME-2 cluster archaeon]|nr:hypothetical protein [ANME-2 cluster archaeon]
MIIAPVALAAFPEKSIIDIGEWVMVGGLLSSVIDLDIVTLVLIRSRKERRLKPFMNPLEIYRNFELFMDTITETGVLMTGLKTHLIFSTLVILVFYLVLNVYFIPVALGVASHILCDIPNVRRLIH